MATDDIPPAALWAAHDHLFRWVFSKPLHARGMLQRMLPAALVASLDWSTLKLVPSTYVHDVLRSTASDLLFAVAARAGGRVLVYLLWEHQSSQDPYMPLRLFGYGAQALTDYVRAHPESAGPIPRLIPLVLYQGPGRWTAPRRLSELCEPSPGARELVELELIVHELGEEDAEVLAAARTLTALARAALVALQLVAARADLAAHAALLGRLLGEVRAAHGARALRSLLLYLLRTRGRERDLRAIMNATDVTTRVIVQTAYDKLIQRGRTKGKAEGKAEGKADMLLLLLQARFGRVPAEVIERIRHAPVAQLDRWAKRLLTSASLDELFGR